MQVEEPKLIGEMTVAELIHHIVATHHAFLKLELPRLETLFAGAASGTDGLLPALEIFRGLKAELDQHLWKEEKVLFPHILRLEQAAAEGVALPPPPFGTVRNPIRMMELEHEHATAELRDLRAATGDYEVPGGAPDAYRILMTSLAELDADLETHIHLENDLLHPRAAALES